MCEYAEVGLCVRHCSATSLIHIFLAVLALHVVSFTPMPTMLH